VAGCLPPWLLRFLCLLDAHSSHTLRPQVNVLTNRCRTTFVYTDFEAAVFVSGLKQKVSTEPECDSFLLSLNSQYSNLQCT
jgi:hypothetical protein